MNDDFECKKHRFNLFMTNKGLFYYL